jgi:hypothetical protein
MNYDKYEIDYYESGKYEGEDNLAFEYEDMHGFWQKVVFELDTGYLFSGYLAFGNQIKLFNSSKSFVMFELGFQCDLTEYSPTMNYYALSRQNDSIYFEKVKLKFDLRQNYGEDLKNKFDDVWFNFPYRIETDIDRNVSFIIGSSVLLKEYIDIDYNIQAVNNGYLKEKDILGSFIYPEQLIRYYHNKGKSTAIKGNVFANILPDSTLEYKYNLKYILNANKAKDDRSEQSLLLETMEVPERHANYQTPKVRIVSDINGDGILDVIVYSMTMVDSCGVCWTNELFISNRNNKKLMSRVAVSETCNCVT